MDHVINKINLYLEISMDQLIEEFKSNEYSKLSECPSYHECKAMVDSIHVLEKYYYGEAKTQTVKKQMEWRL
jgi:hypothetical protein